MSTLLNKKTKRNKFAVSKQVTKAITEEQPDRAIYRKINEK